jgi:GT2 family glycosyltransferase
MMNLDNVLFILVLYKVACKDSKAYQSLCALLSQEDLEGSLYIHDNTSCNIYLVGAYTQGYQVALQRGRKWVVFLDADTTITQSYLDALKQCISNGNFRVFAPQLVSPDGKRLSPTKRYGINVAFNSGMVMHTDAIRQIGGFNARYPLDYLDYYTCWQLQNHDIKICPMDISLVHHLSVEDYTNVSQERYCSVLKAEKQFASDTGRIWQYRLLLIARCCKWLLTNHKYTLLTIKHLFR